MVVVIKNFIHLFLFSIHLFRLILISTPFQIKFIFAKFILLYPGFKSFSWKLFFLCNTQYYLHVFTLKYLFIDLDFNFLFILQFRALLRENLISITILSYYFLFIMKIFLIEYLIFVIIYYQLVNLTTFIVLDTFLNNIIIMTWY